MAHESWGATARVVIAERKDGASSPGCHSTLAQSIVRPSSRGGVPVFNRAMRRPSEASERERLSAGGSPTRPPGRVSSPVKSLPPRSEEHTSELQSLMRISYAVFCLKKKKKK